MADIKVTFSDGEEIIYENVPDSVTADDVIARAGKENTGKAISAVEKLKPTAVEQPAPPEPKAPRAIPKVTDIVDDAFGKNNGMVVGDDFTRQLGLFGRYAAGAATAVPEMLSDPFSNIVNAMAGREVMTPIAKSRERVLESLNVPKPQTPSERVIGAVTQSGLSLATPAGVAKYVPGLPASVQGLLTEAPITQAGSALTAPFLAQTAQEYGAGPGLQAALGVVGSIAGGGAAGMTPATTRAIQGTVKPFTEAGREVIAGNVLRSLAREPEEAILAGQTYKPSIPGYAPTTAQATRDLGLIGAETTIKGLDTSGKFGAQLTQANQARMSILDRMAKDKADLELAIKKRDEVSDPLREQAFAKSTVTPETFQSAVALTVNKKIDDILASPAGKRSTVMSVLEDAKADIARANTPADLYEIRKDLRMAAQGLLDKSEKQGPSSGAYKAAKKELEQVIRSVDEAIESAAPGYRDYLRKYAQSSRGIERLEAAQDFRGRVLTTTPDPSNAGQYLISQPKFTTAIRAAQKDTKLSKTQLAVLERLSKDLDEGVLARAVKVPGSDTFKNLSTANVIGGVIGKQMFGEVSPGLAKLTAPMNWLYNGTDDAIRELLVDAMLDPKLASRLMSKASVMTVEPLSNELKKKAISLGYGATFGLTE